MSNIARRKHRVNPKSSKAPPQHTPEDDEAIDLHQPPAPGAEVPAPGDGTFALRNQYGWSVRFQVRGDAVTLRRSYRGLDVDERTLDRPAARLFWARLRRQGFERLEGRF